jgi:hypothetical protein
MYRFINTGPITDQVFMSSGAAATGSSLAVMVGFLVLLATS